MKYLLSTLTISILIFLGRVSGLIRELSLANVLGSSSKADIAIAIFTLPDLFTAFFLGGGFSLVIVPLISQKGKNFYKNILYFFSKRALIFLTAISALAFIFRSYLFSILAPGIEISEFNFFDKGFFLICLSIIFAGFSSLLSSFLGAKEIFFTSYVGTFIFNSLVIFSIFFLIDSDILMSISYGVFLGSFLRLLIQILNISFLNLKLEEESIFSLEKGFYLKFFSAVIFISTLALLPIISRSYASGFGEGMLSMFHYSLRIIELPITFLILPLLIASFPSVSSFFLKTSEKEKKIFILLVLRTGIIFSSILSIPLFLFSDELIRSVYFFANFDNFSFKSIGEIFKWGVLIIPALSIISILQYLISSSLKTAFLIWPSLLILLFHVIFSYTLKEIFNFNGVLISYIFTYYFFAIIMCLNIIKIHNISFFQLISKIYLGIIPIIFSLIFSFLISTLKLNLIYSFMSCFIIFIISFTIYLLSDKELKEQIDILKRLK